jgi:phage terminase large subunit
MKPMREVTLQMSSKQRQFVSAVMDESSPYDEIGFGGARGPGKSFASAVCAVLGSVKYRDIRTLLLRRGLTAAVNNYRDEIRKVLHMLGMPDAARWKEKEKVFIFPAARSEIHLGYCSVDKDVEQYLGLQYARIGLEEATQFRERTVEQIRGSNRSNNDQCPGRMWLTTNPGGPGHKWMKERFATMGGVLPPTRLWIPAKITDNPALFVNDPTYVERVLKPLPYWLRRQWLDGDWDAVAGQFWTIGPHLLQEIEPPRWAKWFAGVDWGSAKPFACVWFAKWSEWMKGPAGFDEIHRIHVVHEVYQDGLQLDEQAQRVLAEERKLPLGGKRVVYYADPNCWKKIEGVSTETGKTLAGMWARYKWFVNPASTNARVPGWTLIKGLLRQGQLTISPGCRALLTEATSHQYEGAPGPPTGEDMRQGNEIDDHAWDALRYGIVSVANLRASKRPISAYELPQGVAA